MFGNLTDTEGMLFVNLYNWYSFVHGSFFALVLLASLISFAHRIIENKFVVKWNPAFLINLFTAAASICGMCQFVNYKMLKYSNQCYLAISTDLSIALLYLATIQTILSTEMGFIIQGLQKKRSDRISKINFYLPIVLQFLIFLNGFVPDVLFCNSESNIAKNNFSALIFTCFAFFGTSFFFYKCLKLALQIRKKLMLDYDGVGASSILPIKDDDDKLGTMTQKGEEHQYFVRMYRKYIFYSALSIFVFGYQINEGAAFFNNDAPQVALGDTDTIFSPFNNITIYLIMILLTIAAYNNRKFTIYIKTLTPEVANIYFFVLGIWSIFFVVMCSLIFNDYFTYVAVPISFFAQFFITLLLLSSQGSMNRSEELSACINYNFGNVLNWRNVMFMSFEVATLTFVSLDSLYLWWIPPWAEQVAFILFNAISSADTDYLEYVLPDVSSRVVTNSLISFIFVLVILMASTAFLRLPNIIWNFLNFLSYLTFDIFIMSISSLLLRRLKCHDPLQGNVKNNDSLSGTGYLIGYNEIMCNTSYFEYVYTFDYLMVIIGLLICYGLTYFLLIRNKTSLPNIWFAFSFLYYIFLSILLKRDISGWSGLKMVLKFVIVCGINLTPKNYFLSPWIRASINLICTILIAFTSFVMMPCLGPQVEFVNLYRTSAYSFATFCSLMSFIGLIILSTCGLENKVAGNVMSVLTVTVPILGSFMIFLIGKRKKHPKLNSIKRVCELATSSEATIEGILIEYEESIRLFGKEENSFSFLPALALHYSSDSLTVISSALKTRLECFIALNTFKRNLFECDGIPSAFSFLEKASQYPEGSQVIKRKFLPLLAKCFIVCERYYSDIDLRAIQNDTLGTNEPINQVENVIVSLLETILIPLSKILTSICQKSKFYFREISISYPSLFPLVLKLRNFDVFLLENKFYDSHEPHSTEVFISSIDVFDCLLKNDLRNSQIESENLMISIIVSKGNDLEREKVNALKIELGNLILVGADKIKGQKYVNKIKENISSSSSRSPQLASNVLFGANRVYNEELNDSNQSSTFPEKFALCDKSVFQASKLENDALVILSINPIEITKASITGVVEDIFGKMKAKKRRRRAIESKNLRASTDGIIHEILNKKNKGKIIVVIGIYSTIADSKINFGFLIENVKREFMDEWRKKDNVLNRSIEIVLEIQGFSKEEEFFTLKKNGEILSISEQLKEYMSNLTGKIKKTMLERKRKKEFWAVNGLEI